MLSRQSTSRRRAASESGKHPEIESPESKVACEHTRNRVLNGIGRAHMYVRIGLGTVRGRPCVRPRGSDPNPTMRVRAADNPVHLCRSVSANESLTDSG